MAGLPTEASPILGAISNKRHSHQINRKQTAGNLQSAVCSSTYYSVGAQQQRNLGAVSCEASSPNLSQEPPHAGLQNPSASSSFSSSFSLNGQQQQPPQNQTRQPRHEQLQQHLPATFPTQRFSAEQNLNNISAMSVQDLSSIFRGDEELFPASNSPAEKLDFGSDLFGDSNLNISLEDFERLQREVTNTSPEFVSLHELENNNASASAHNSALLPNLDFDGNSSSSNSTPLFDNNATPAIGSDLFHSVYINDHATFTSDSALLSLGADSVQNYPGLSFPELPSTTATSLLNNASTVSESPMTRTGSRDSFDNSLKMSSKAGVVKQRAKPRASKVLPNIEISEAASAAERKTKKNTLAARESRQRKREHLDKMEAENEALREKIALLEGVVQENALLRARLHTLGG